MLIVQGDSCWSFIIWSPRLPIYHVCYFYRPEVSTICSIIHIEAQKEACCQWLPEQSYSGVFVRDQAIKAQTIGSTCHEFIKINSTHLKKVELLQGQGLGWQAQSPGRSLWELKVFHSHPIHKEEAASHCSKHLLSKLFEQQDWSLIFFLTDQQATRVLWY